MIPEPFTDEQKQYLEGYFTALRQQGGIPFLGQNEAGQFTSEASSPSPTREAETVFGTPIEDLCKEERIKHEGNGLDLWDTIVANAAADRFPDGGDTFRYKFHGLFHVKPAQDSFMLRCRIAGGRLTSSQLTGLAEIAEDWGGGYADCTTRANLQIREIRPRDTIDVLMKLDELGLTSKGSGADNIRNVTASPTTGFDPIELLDVMPYARALHHYILNHRDLYGLPRKFNISFDSGGVISVCADTNDIGFYACRVPEGVAGVESGVYFRVQLCGITGHKQFAADCGILVRPKDSIAVAAAMVRVFIEHGDRTNRKKARLKYLIDDWGVPKFLEKVQEKLAFPLTFLPLESCQQRKETAQHGHIGVHPQKKAGFHYLGVVVPVGRLLPAQMKGLADLGTRYGQGELRLTVWQNLLIPHIAEEHVEAVKTGLRALGLTHTTSSLRGGLIACTGNRGCKYAATDTKGHAVALGEHLAEQFSLDQPINIHLTGCPHSCAQHYIGDIGLLGAKVKREGATVEGYHVVFGGGVDERQAIAHEIFKSVPFDELKPLLENVIKVYLHQREAGEAFGAFTRRHSPEQLKELFQLDPLAI
jgi:ferredoxin-nitrite reductase